MTFNDQGIHYLINRKNNYASNEFFEWNEFFLKNPIPFESFVISVYTMPTIGMNSRRTDYENPCEFDLIH